MINLQNVSLRRGTNLLISKVDWTIYHKQRIGLIGSNGSGKSTLFAMFRDELQPDAGEFNMPPRLRISHVAQETPSLTTKAIDYVIQGDVELAALLEKLTVAEEKEDGEQICAIHEKLAGIDGYTATARAAQLLVGLSFSHDDQNKMVKEFSGGWRVRLNLARALMCRSDMLLLDEPTNHLDLDAVIWLEEWLRGYSGTLILISHDRDFLDTTVDHIAFIKNQTLKVYSGNYSTFEKTYADSLRLQQAAFEKQQKHINHMMVFVNKFRAKASKAKQAQSRLKAIEKIEQICAVQAESQFQFEFLKPDTCPYPLIQLRKAGVQYGDHIVLRNINLSLAPKERIGVLGPNGAGKSSLIKLLAGDLPASPEVRETASGLKVGYFAQHQIDHLRLDESPMAHMQHLAPRISDLEIRKYLGRFGFSGDFVLKHVGTFSGGEKTRLALALLVWQKPNLLLLDEPTNHLDMEMRTALSLALQEYEGAMLLVSHDRFLLRSTVDEFILVADGQVKSFDGDLDEYQRWLTDYRKRKKIARDGRGEVVISKKELQEIEEKRQRDNRPLENKLKKIETELEKWEKKLSVAELLLADLTIYEENNKAKLQKTLLEQANIKKEIESLEASWLEVTAEMND